MMHDCGCNSACAPRVRMPGRGGEVLGLLAFRAPVLRAALALCLQAGCAWGKGPPRTGEDPAQTDLARSEAAAVPSPSAAPAPQALPDGAYAHAGCDLTGRWIVRDATVQVGLGGAVRQQTLLLEYWDVAQKGLEFQLIKHRVCDIRSHSIGALAATEVYYAEAYRDALRDHVRLEGRRGLSGGLDADTCALSVAEAANVRGASLPYYAEPSHGLPREPAADDAPGTEDWDGDGQPGMSVQVTGAATGLVFSAFRSFDAPFDTFPAHAARFSVAESFRVERVLLGSDPAGVPSTPLSASADPADNTRTFLRFEADTDGLGDDVLCERVRDAAGADFAAFAEPAS
jgi:hypothetical protein